MNSKPQSTQELIMKLRLEGKVVELNKEEHLQTIQLMNQHLEVVRRDYKIKERNSIESASKAVLTV